MKKMFSTFKTNLKNINFKSINNLGIFSKLLVYVVISFAILVPNFLVLERALSEETLLVNATPLILFNLMALVLPVLVFGIYNKNDKNINKDLNENNYKNEKEKGIKKLVCNFLKIEGLVLLVTTLSSLGLIFLNMYSQYKVNFELSTIIGISIVSLIYSLITFASFEIIENKKKAMVVSMLALNIPYLVQIVLGKIILLSSTTIYHLLVNNTYFIGFTEGLIEYKTLIINLIYILVLLTIILIDKNINEIKEKVKNKLNKKNIKIPNILKEYKKILVGILILSSIIFGYTQINLKDTNYIGKIDLTKTKKYTLSKELIDTIKKIDKEVLITYKGNNSKIDYYKVLINEIKTLNNNVKFVVVEDRENKLNDGISEGIYINLVNNPDKKKYVINLNASQETVITSSKEEGKAKLIIESEIIEGLNTITKDSKETNIAIYNSYEDLQKNNVLYMESVINFFESKGRKVNIINSLSKDKLENISMLVFTTLDKDITNEELENLKEMKNNGANFLVLRTTFTKDSSVKLTPVFDQFLKEYAINLPLKGIVLEQDNSKRGVSNVQLTAEEKKAEQEKTGSIVNTKKVYDNSIMYVELNDAKRVLEYAKLRFPNIAPIFRIVGAILIDEEIKAAKNVEVLPIYTTTENAHYSDEFTADDFSLEKLEKGQKGRYNIATLSTIKNETNESKLVAVANLYMFIDNSNEEYFQGIKLGSLLQTKQFLNGVLNEFTNPDGKIIVKEDEQKPYVIEEDTKKDGSELSKINKAKAKQNYLLVYGISFTIIGLIVVILKNIKFKDNK